MGLIVLLIFVILLVSQQVLGQEVETRNAGDKISPDGNGQQRTIYSQRHLSPHRMMHFGKRPSNPAPPTVLTQQGYDPYVPLAAVAHQRQQQRPNAYLQQDSPFLFTIELEQGRTIQALPEELAPFETLQPIGEALYNLERPQAELFGYNLAEQSALRQAASQTLGRKHKLMKLMENSNNDADGGIDLTNNLVSAERAQSSANAQEDNNQQQAAISVSTRSMQASRPNSLNLPKAYISSLLYGRQGSSSMPNYGGFNKKAEPKDNFFMHFGRK